MSRDRRFDGRFITAVHTTGIYCRPSCPARTPARGNVSFYATAAAAQGAGFRACKRCLPDASPGDPGWDVVADVAGRAMRLIADGTVDREGVAGLAAKLGYTPRHLGRILATHYGAGPLALARARRAQTARVLVETTTLPLSDVAHAAGFTSLRQFNDTFRTVYATAPSQLRRNRGSSVRPRAATGAGPAWMTVEHRLAVRTPFAGRALLAFLAQRAVKGVEVAGEGWFARTLDLPHGPGAVRLELEDHLQPGGVAQVRARFRLTRLADLAAAVERTRRLLDADCDPVAVDGHLSTVPGMQALVRRRPGLRVPGQVSGAEAVVRAVLGQQVTLAAARRLTEQVVEWCGPEVVVPGEAQLTRLFPDPARITAAALDDLPMPRSRGETLRTATAALVDGTLRVDHSVEREDVRRALVAIRGVGDWTADYVVMRALAHPDVLLTGDAGTRRSLTRHGIVLDDGTGGAWRPWRSYAQLHLWQALADETIDKEDPCGP